MKLHEHKGLLVPSFIYPATDGLNHLNQPLILIENILETNETTSFLILQIL